MKVSFHKTFHHFFWWTKKKTHPSPTNLLLFFLGQFHFLEPTKKRSWLCFNRALFGLSRLPTGVDGSRGFPCNRFVEPPGGYDSFSPRPKLQSKGCSAGFFLGCFWSWGVWGWQKTYWDGKKSSKIQFYIHILIYWYTHVINTHVMHFGTRAGGLLFQRKLIFQPMVFQVLMWVSVYLSWEPKGEKSPKAISPPRNILQGINISPWEGIFEDDFPFPQVGYVNFLEGKALSKGLFNL